MTAIYVELRHLTLGQLRGRNSGRSLDRLRQRCDGLSLPALDAVRPAPFFMRACEYAFGDERRIDGPAFAECLRVVTIARLAAFGIGAPLPRPNVIVVLTDDQRWDTIDATYSPIPGSGMPAMPAVYSRLAAEGVTFTQAVVTTPICGPSRGSFFTGRHTHRHGMLSNTGGSGPVRFKDDDTFATRLSAAGYRTGFLGKYTNGLSDLEDAASGGPYVPPGWDDFRVFDHPQSVPQLGFRMLENGLLVDYGAESAPYATDVLSDHAVDFIDTSLEATDGRPFALWISTSTPHHPWYAADRHQGAFSRVAWPSRPNFYEADVSDKPAFIRNQAPIDLLRLLGQLRKRQIQLAMQLSTDEMVARLIDHLDALGVGDDTIVIFASDNGEAWGEHRWNTKACPWEACLRVPMIVRYPRMVPGRRVESGLVANVDVLPTLLGLVGDDAHEDMDGVDLREVLLGAEVPPSRDVLIEAYSSTQLNYAGIRADSMEYVRYRWGEEALYDLEVDPWELENWIDSPDHVSVVDAMRDRLDALWPGFDEVATD